MKNRLESAWEPKLSAAMEPIAFKQGCWHCGPKRQEKPRQIVFLQKFISILAAMALMVWIAFRTKWHGCKVSRMRQLPQRSI
ncbi:hypothetical protein AN401_07610 [Zobellella denitrificans]|uniref:Uncharacterized protein n=1 Tax=Zobellella denitrificans TaxID=347534 RepID=A0A291HNM3_9GAMM|nr:hypothetical protein AN401_07610 [Zobellella denitrificans]